MLFLDASAVIKAYVPEAGSPSVHGAIARMRGQLYLSRAVVLEVLAVFARKRRRDELTRAQYRAARESFLRELEAKYKVLEVARADFELAVGMVDTFQGVAVGPMDLLHVASALQSHAPAAPEPIVASSDGGFLTVARAAGLPTFDPETQPLSVLIALQRRFG